jgi:hypothetical protein
MFSPSARALLSSDPIIPALRVPDIVAGISVTPGTGSAAITWDEPEANSSAITGYRVQIDDGSGFETVRDTADTTRSFDASDLTGGALTRVRIAARNSDGLGAYSVPVEFVPLVPASVPGQPTGVSVSIGDGEAEATWNPPADNGGAPITDYVLELSEDGGATWSTVADGAGSATTALLEGLTNGTRYRLRVSAVNEAGQGQVSQAADFTPQGAIAQAGLAMGELTDRRVYQRSSETGGAFGKGSAAIAVPITLTAEAASIEYRLIDPDTDQTVVNWSTAGTDIAASTTELTLEVPAALGWYALELRANQDNAQVVRGQNRFAVGRVIAVAGQSLATRMIDNQGMDGTFADFGLTVPENCSVYATYLGPNDDDTPVWAPPNEGGFGSEYSSTFLPEFFRLQTAAAGVTCAIVGHAVGGASAWQFRDSGTDGIQLASVLEDVGGFEAFIWFQGHSDRAGNDYGSTLGQRFTEFAGYNALRAGDFEKYVATIPNVQHEAYQDDAQNILEIRAEAQAWCEANGAVYVQPNDLEMDDTLHQSQAGNITLAHHFHRATLPALGLPGDHLGPAITAASRTGSTITLQVTHRPGATALVAEGNVEDIFSVFADGDLAAELPIASASVAAAEITLELANDPGSVALDVYAGLAPDKGTPWADNIYDNHTDGDGITDGRLLQVTLAPVDVAAVAAPATRPAAIDDLAVTAGDGDADASWSAPASGGDPITDYVLELSDDGGSTWSVYADGVGATNAATVNSLANGTEYRLRVAAVNGIGTANWSNVATFTPESGAAAPAAIDDLAVTAGDGDANASWSAPASGGDPITDYVLELSDDGGSTWSVYADGVGTETSATIEALANDTEYRLRVAAVNGIGTANWSNVATFTPEAAGGDTPVGFDLDGSGASFATGRFGQALSATTIEVQDQDIAPEGTDTFTVECWVRRADQEDKIALSGEDRWWIGCDGANTWFRITTAGGNKVHLARNAAPVPAGVWHHMALVCHPGGARAYLDGVEVGSTTDLPAQTAGRNPAALIGGIGPLPQFNWDGEIDEVAVFDTERYTANFTPPTAPYTGNEPGLVQLWHFDGDTLSARV